MIDNIFKVLYNKKVERQTTKILTERKVAYGT